MQSGKSPSFAGLRILVVEDEYLVAVHIESLLEDFGCEVVGPVATIEDALTIVRSQKVDGVLLDANLNGHSSAPIAAALVTVAISFIVVTGYGQLRLETDALDSAPRLTKPFLASELERAIAATFAVRP